MHAHLLFSFAMTGKLLIHFYCCVVLYLAECINGVSQMEVLQYNIIVEFDLVGNVSDHSKRLQNFGLETKSRLSLKKQY